MIRPKKDRNMHKVLALQISGQIDIKTFKESFKAKLIAFDSDELFYEIKPTQFIQVFKYGVVCFLNYDEVKTTEFIKLISDFCRKPLENDFREEFLIQTTTKKPEVGHNLIKIEELNRESARLIMLNVSQSVALSYYASQSNLLLELTNQHTLKLEKNGRLDISGKRLKKFIGKTMNLKNRITQNLYIFDAAPGTWESEQLDRMDVGLKKIFDLEMRYRSLHEELEIVRENLDLFKDILHHRDSSNLEWIIIILILVEVVNLFFEKGLLHFLGS